jgi:hypothetical protein
MPSRDEDQDLPVEGVTIPTEDEDKIMHISLPTHATLLLEPLPRVNGRRAQTRTRSDAM